MELEESIKLLKEMQENCKNKTIYKDEKAEAKAEAIEVVLKELEEKTTIIMAGAEKVKQLEKEFITKQEVKDNYIPKYKIREKIKELEEYIVKIEEETCGRCITIGEDMCIRYLKELLEEE